VIGDWYLRSKDGREHYCFSKQPSYECPIGSAQTLGDVLELACEELEIKPEFLLRRIKHSADRKRAPDGKVTELCATCGHKLRRLGFRYWIEGKPPADASDGVKLNARLSGDGMTQLGPSYFAKSRADAQAWARMRANEGRED